MTRLTLLALVLTVACSREPPPSTSAGPPPTTAAPAEPATSPCATDGDCRLYDGPACSCRVALHSATVTPSETPCFAPPCMNREAYCDAATHACAIRETPPPPPPSSEAPATDVAPPPGLDSVGPIS